MNVMLPYKPPWSRTARLRLTRSLLLFLILIAFARLAFRLDAKSLWWDESLSLQRAESGWSALIAGHIGLTDGSNIIPTLDQHPFAFFALLGVLIRIAGSSEFVLRFPSVMAATLLVPMCWTLARCLVRQRALPATTPMVAALLAAINPFYLWYGQEARMYTLVALLALCSTYLLLRWAEAGSPRAAYLWLLSYAVVAALLFSTHFLALLILPVQVIVVFDRRARRNIRLAALAVVTMGALGTIWVALNYLSRQGQGWGSNFTALRLAVLIPDLVNAFSLGLSVDARTVRWLDLLFAGLALLGFLWCRRPGHQRAERTWLLPLLVIVPILELEVVQRLQPVYMNARHMSLISGAFLLAVSGGLAWLWEERRWAGAGVGAVLLVASVYSSINYYALPVYDKDDIRGLGQYLRQQIQPGDLVLLNPPEMMRLWRYYLPLDAAPTGSGIEYQGVPLLVGSMADSADRMQALSSRHRRTWVVNSGMVPLNALLEPAREWPISHLFQVKQVPFHSSTSFLELRLFLPQPPVFQKLPAAPQRPLDAMFGLDVRLAGIDIGEPLFAGGAVPVTLYWQPLAPPKQRLKYILRLSRRKPDGQWQDVAITEREPYDGALPTTTWQTGQTIVEYSELEIPAHAGATPGPYRLTVQMYDAATGQKLPANASGIEVNHGDESLVLSYAK